MPFEEALDPDSLEYIGGPTVVQKEEKDGVAIEWLSGLIPPARCARVTCDGMGASYILPSGEIGAGSAHDQICSRPDVAEKMVAALVALGYPVMPYPSKCGDIFRKRVVE
jgi:hypothetical protein